LSSADPSSEVVFKAAHVVTVTLTCDHRVVDGAVAAAWLAAYKDLLQNPEMMLL
jgi:pyruvate dehydrogenase E2 component (dihydrolipoamide acetyltransferase)